MLSGKVGFDSFESEARQLTAPLNSKITLHCDENFEQRYPEAWGANIKAEMKDGNVIMAHRDHAKGDPDAPLSPKEMKEKAVMLFKHAEIEEPLKWTEKILRFHKDDSSFTENDLHHLMGLKA
jgi:2-methylcitrate dehydratase PrpD